MNTLTLSQFNSLPMKDAQEVLTHCCGSHQWVQKMEKLRPFSDLSAVFSSSSEIWNGLTQEDWKEAFSHHPKIGDLDSLKKKFASTRVWAEQEQRGSEKASIAVLQALALGNQNYENRFGYIFIVCATGKSAEQMLNLLEARLRNDPAQEIKLAAAEQEKITLIRLEKLIHE
ncbi:MAG: 2-oxo-4-hydroxy-4-carboxy-5-ureidoimidazoline decarboxylase [Deltaproteobacteria bacterium]